MATEEGRSFPETECLHGTICLQGRAAPRVGTRDPFMNSSSMYGISLSTSFFSPVAWE